jgi:hypothetical protein
MVALIVDSVAVTILREREILDNPDNDFSGNVENCLSTKVYRHMFNL